MILRTLVIYDVSSMVYAGTTSKYGTDYFSKDSNNKLKGLPVGGIKRILNHALLKLHAGNAILFCFDSQTDRKQVFEGYKSTRKGNPDVFIQLQMLQELCDRIGIPYLKIPNYEADDIISAVVHQHINTFVDLEIITGDSDIASNLISDKVQIIGSASIYPNITVSDYMYTISQSCTIEYNQVLPYYFCFGKVSNNVPPLFSNSAACTKLYEDFVTFCEGEGIAPAYRSELSTFAKWMVSGLDSGKFTASEVDSYFTRSQLIYPKEIEDESLIAFKFPGPEELYTSELKKVLKLYELFRIADLYKFSDVTLHSPIPRELMTNLMNWRSIYEGGSVFADADINPDMSQFINKTSRFIEGEGDF